MRELKIRAWHKPYKQMCNVSMLQFDYDGTICAAVIIEKPFNDQRLAKIDDLIIEQFTGLKDKNGTEIYEGDILIDDTGEPIEYCVVRFSEGGFIGECAGVSEPLFELTSLEVVGNIHENPELLEEK